MLLLLELTSQASFTFSYFSPSCHNHHLIPHRLTSPSSSSLLAQYYHIIPHLAWIPSHAIPSRPLLAPRCYIRRRHVIVIIIIFFIIIDIIIIFTIIIIIIIIIVSPRPWGLVYDLFRLPTPPPPTYLKTLENATSQNPH